MKLNETFLIIYSPKSSLRTTESEVNWIKNILVQDINLDKLSIEELQMVRKNVVGWYDEHTRDKNAHDFGKLRVAMMSITSVIDNILYLQHKLYQL